MKERDEIYAKKEFTEEDGLAPPSWKAISPNPEVGSGERSGSTAQRTPESPMRSMKNRWLKWKTRSKYGLCWPKRCSGIPISSS